MTSPDSERSTAEPAFRLKTSAADPNKEPDWTRGLKRLYDSVLEEPMPDNFKDLLAKLDNDPK